MSDERPNVGPGIEWSDEDLDAMAEIGPDDIASAEAVWKRDAPADLAGLIDAKPEEDAANG